MSSEQLPGMQMRLAFTAEPTPVACRLTLRGLTVHVAAPPTHAQEAADALRSVGASVMPDDEGLRLAAADLTALADLPPHFHLIGDLDTTVLVTLLERPSHADAPVVLDADAQGLTLAWFDGQAHWAESISEKAGTALLHCGLPVVATPEAWEVLSSGPDIPVVAGWAHAHVDGYIEIAAAVPQLVAASGLPALWRIDESRFGLPGRYADAIGSCPVVRWAGPPPVRERPPAIPSDFGFELSSHAAADLSSLVASLAADKAQVLLWESGLGRRVAALAALQVLDAFPLLVVCHPSAVFAWRRHADLLGRTCTLLTPRGAEISVITYADLAAHRVLPSFAAVLFDDLPAAIRQGGSRLVSAVHRFDALADAYRVATTSAWPVEPAEVASVLGVLKPAEFDPLMPLELRYPAGEGLRGVDRAVQHAEAYVSRRGRAEAAAQPFHRSSVCVVSTSPEQQRAFADLSARAVRLPQVQVLSEALELTSAGPMDGISPKVGAAAGLSRDATSVGDSAALLTRHRRTSTLLRGAIGMGATMLVDAAADPMVVREQLAAARDSRRAAVVLYDRALPDLRAFDSVVVVDMPYSMAALDRAVGAAGDPEGSARVTMVHLRGSIDDRLAVLAATRAELDSVCDATGTLDGREIAYLLTPRSGW